MSEIQMFYIVSDYNHDGFYRYSLKGYNLLTLAETSAKEQTENQTTKYIHRHSLEVVKTFKVDDKPRETTTGKHFCKFENCSETQRKMYHGDSHDDYCWFHTAVTWYTMTKSYEVKNGEETRVYAVPKMTKAKARKLLKELVDIFDEIESYNDKFVAMREKFFANLLHAGVARMDEYAFISRSKKSLKGIVIGLIEGGNLL